MRASATVVPDEGTSDRRYDLAYWCPLRGIHLRIRHIIEVGGIDDAEGHCGVEVAVDIWVRWLWRYLFGLISESFGDD